MKGGTEGEAVDEAGVGAHEGAVPVGAGIQEPNVALLHRREREPLEERGPKW